MMDRKIGEAPVFFARNRVGRVYLGGKLFADFFGDPPEDGFLPEEWIASSVAALNENPLREKEGVSRLLGTDIYFDDVLRENPEALLGPKGKLRILVKGLDSAIRLPAQVHPDKAFSRAHFGSEYGKTECWLILGTRPNAKIYFGFRPEVTREMLEAAIDQSEKDPAAMEALMQTVEPAVGEVYFVPARTVHAIGKGCLILEVQEPTDFTIQPERYCGEYRLSDREMYLGLSRETAVSCFDFGKPSAPRVAPVLLQEEKGCKLESLVSEAQTDCFVINRITLSGGVYQPSVNESYGIYVITRGEGKILSAAGEAPYERNLHKGDYFFLPYGAMGKFSLVGEMEVVECY